jgi:hypothetical protein
VPLEHMVIVMELTPPAKMYLLVELPEGALIVTVHPAYAEIVTALPLPEIIEGETLQPESVKVALEPELPIVSVTDFLTVALLLTVSAKVPELDAWIESPG